ncbi:MAG TPA: type I DNA topoisomerase [Patescibacteria group bacterium]|nr:type I DNA topoisomerase [Patescibacteria group bacterium]
MKSLILVESPTKAKTLTRFLGDKYIIEASMGHIRDLPKGALGVDIEHNFEPKYVIPKDKRKIIEGLKSDVKDVDRVILATDPDREGEAISFHLKEVLSDEVKKGTKFDRIVFHEITPRAINEALEHPKDIDMNLVEAQTGRRVLDRVVGYKLSPVLWMKIKKGLSAGRVQSIALRLIVEREQEVARFKSEDFARVFVVLYKDKKTEPITLELVKIDSENIESTNTIKLYDGEYNYKKTGLSENDAENLKKELATRKFTVADLSQKETKRSPYPPFTTSMLQMEASRRFGYPSKRTMSLAQRLYEEGFITYHRTDSYNLSADFLREARDYIEKNFGKKYLPETPRTYQTKSKLAQEAHEAIRPTNLFENEEAVSAKLGKDFAKLYNLIYKRALSTQMNDAIFLSSRLDVESKNGKTYLFQANGRVMKFDGFLKVWFYEDDEQLIPTLAVNDNLNLLEVKNTLHKTTPPPRYNEASIIGALEKHGIGRPSTYAPIISTITARFYVEKDEGRFKPTEIGTMVNNFLVKNFGEIDDIPFTATMEDKLDEVAEGKIGWVPIVKDFYTPLEKHIEKAEKEEKIEIKLEKTGEICPLDGGDVVIRVGRFGKFKACSNFPTCKFRESIVEDSGYLCPRDQGKMVMKRTRKGRTFYGCGNYPKCDFAVWTKAELEKQAVPVVDPNKKPEAKATETPEPQVN